MCRYPCQSSLILRICLKERTLGLTLRHSRHPSYEIRELSREIVEFIQENCHQTPAELYTRISSSDLPVSDRVDSAQVYYKWQQSLARNWRHHNDCSNHELKLVFFFFFFFAHESCIALLKRNPYVHQS